MSSPTLDSSPKIFDKPPPTHHERRQHRRDAPSLRCFVAGECYAALVRVHDLSLGGVSVRAPLPFAPGDEIAITIELHDGKVIRARAVTVWVRGGEPEHASPRVGARFVELYEGSEELRQLCRP